MCNCITKIENELKQKGYKDADIKGIIFSTIGDVVKMRTVQDCTYTEGFTKSRKDRLKHIPIKHEYCPFCGKKYE